MNNQIISPYLASEYIKSINDPKIKFLYTLSKGDYILPFKTLNELKVYVKKSFKIEFVNKDKTALAGLVYLYKTDESLYNLNVNEFLALLSQENITSKDEDEYKNEDEYKDEDEYFQKKSNYYKQDY